MCANPWLRAAGKYSYAGYMFHPSIVGHLLRLHGIAGGWLLFAVATVITYTAARVSWSVYEAPILHLKRYVPERTGRVAITALHDRSGSVSHSNG